MDASLYDTFAEMEQAHWWFQGRRSIVASVLERRLEGDPAERTILDVGCGTGEMLDMLAAFGQVRGLDMSPLAVHHCRNRFGTTVDVSVGRIPEDVTGPVAVVTAFDVIEHLDDDLEALQQIRRALAPGGVFVCTVPAFPFLWSRHDELNHHRRRYTRRSLTCALEGAGFRIERMSYFNSVLFPAVAGVRILSRTMRRTGVRAGRRHRPESAGMSMPSRSVNRILSRIFAGERFLLRVGSPPFGVSLLAVCSPRADSSR